MTRSTDTASFTERLAWTGQRVLVTGGTGFLASHLCHRLVEAGAEVHATSRQVQPVGCGTIRWWNTSLSSLEDVQSIFRSVQPTVVYHLAGAVGAKPDMNLVLPTFGSLLASTVYVLIAAVELGCRRIILSGSLTEPCLNLPSPIPSSPYAAAKWASSAYGRMFHALYQAPVVIAVPFMTFGPKQERGKLIPSVILSLLKGEAPRLSSGLWEADWIYVGDVIQGFLDAAVVPGIEGATIELGSGSKSTVKEMVERITTLMECPRKPIFGAVPDRPREPIRVANTTATRSLLGWAPNTSISDGLRQTIDWYAAQHTAGKLC